MALPKLTFHGFRDGSLQDLDALYGIKSNLFINRTSYGGSYWTDPLGLPSQGWYDAVAAGYTNSYKYLQLDHESYPGCSLVSTQAERQAAAHKFSVIYQGLKAVMPTYNIGFYQFPTVRDVFRSTTAHDSAGYLAWQAENEDWAELWANCDTCYPSIYWFYARETNGAGATDGHELYMSENIAETARNRTLYGRPDQAIIPYCSPYKTNTEVFLDPEVWANMTRLAYTEGDGVFLWTGYSVSHTWDGNIPWFRNFLATWPYNSRQLINPRTVATTRSTVTRSVAGARTVRT